MQTKQLYEIQKLQLISPATRPRKRTVSWDTRFNCLEISDSSSPLIILAITKLSKVPVLHTVTDTNKKIKLYPIHEASWWNVGFANSARSTYWFSKFYHILKFRQKVKGFDVFRNNFPYFWKEMQKWISSFVNWIYKPWIKAWSVPDYS